MRTALLIILFATTNAYNPINPINFNVNNKCRTLRGGPGQCVPIKFCPKITSQIATERSSISFVLQGDRCGSHFGQTYACCPFMERKPSAGEPYEFEKVTYSPDTARRTTATNFDFENEHFHDATTRRITTDRDFGSYGRERTTVRDFDTYGRERTTARDFDNYGRERTTARDFDSYGKTRTTRRNYDSDATTRTTIRDYDSDATTRSTVTDSDRSARPTKNEPQNNKDRNRNSNKDVLPKECGIGVSNKILGGQTTEIDEFPWMALVQYRRPNGQITYDCSGALITKRYVLTAAHCVNGTAMSNQRMVLHKIRLGEYDLSTRNDCRGSICNADALQDMDIEEVILHPDYKQSERVQSNDIALIRLKQEAKLSQFVQPICLPTDDSKNYEGKTLTVSGWGRTANVRGSASNVKLKVKVPVMEWSKCSSFYEQFYGNMKLTKSQMCAGGEKGKDSCQGDSGGPLMDSGLSGSEVRWVAIGIVSSGPAACGVEDRPSLYTKVSDFMDWILNNIKN